MGSEMCIRDSDWAGMFSSDPFSICVKRHMNNKFKTNLVALLAIVSGSAFGSGTCLGMQDSENEKMAVGTGIVRPVESSHTGAFGAVASAPNESSYFRRELPPIISPSQATASVPPIVSPSQANAASLPPIVSPEKAIKRELETVAKLPKPKLSPKQLGMLTPLADEAPEVDSESVSYTHLRAHETLRYLVCRLLLEKK